MNVLVVDDSVTMVLSLKTTLTMHGFQVQTACNGREGLEKYQAGSFDLVMTDRAMPEVNGDVLAANIKKINPRQPVILLTGFGDLMSGAGEQPPGVDLVVGKPFTFATLRNAIAKATGR